MSKKNKGNVATATEDITTNAAVGSPVPEGETVSLTGENNGTVDHSTLSGPADPVSPTVGETGGTAPAATETPTPEGGKAKRPKKEAKSTDQLADAIAKKQAAVAQEKIMKEHVKALNAGWKPEPAKLMPLPAQSGKAVANALTFDRRLQMRATGKMLTDKDLAAEYGDAIKDNAKEFPDKIAHGFPMSKNGGFPALKAIRITDEDKIANKLDGNVIVWDGFHTALGAITVAGLREFPCEIMNGTFRFAKLLALGANATHGASRTDADKKYLFRQIVEDADLLADAIELSSQSKGDEKAGGLNRALSIVTGASKGSVTNWLRELGKTTRGNKIVDLPPPAPSEPTAEGSTTAPVGVAVDTMPAMPTLDKFNSAINLHTAVERTFGELMQDEPAREIMVEVSKDYGFPIEQETVVQDGKEVVRFNWPAFDKFVEMLDTFAHVYKTRHTPTTPEPLPAA